MISRKYIEKLKKINTFSKSILFLMSAILFGQIGLWANPNTEKAEMEAQERKVINNMRSAVSYLDTTHAKAQSIIKELDAFYASEISKGFNGAVMVASQGQVLYERYFGMANRAKGIPWANNTSSQLASTSKPFTATAILLLHQEGYMDIYGKVADYIEGFPYQDITVEMLLNHRSGLPDYLKWADRYWSRTANMTNKDLLHLIKRHQPRLTSKPGTKFQYSNTNYALLANIIEEVAQISYPQFMREFIFEPLGLYHTFVYDPLGPKPENIVISYRANWNIHHDDYADGIYGDKGIYSTPADLLKWDRVFYNASLLNVKTIGLSYEPYSTPWEGKRNYGLGWRMDEDVDKVGEKAIYHNGWWHGNNTVFYRFIDRDYTIIVLGNRFNRDIYKQTRQIYSIVRGKEIQM